VLDVASGLRYLHANDVIHRDLKPGNVLLVPHPSTGGGGGGGVVYVAKISDFGVSAAVNLIASTRGTSHGGGPKGTYAYMAPELYDDEIPVEAARTPKLDIYSLGVLANELFTGAAPWQGMVEMAIVRAVLDKRRRPTLFTPSASSPGEQALVALIGSSEGGCWAQAAADRPTAQVLCKSLQPYVPAHVHAPDTEPIAGTTRTLYTSMTLHDNVCASRWRG
jgi:serine/threonine-protein kinase